MTVVMRRRKREGRRREDEMVEMVGMSWLFWCIAWAFKRYPLGSCGS